MAQFIAPTPKTAQLQLSRNLTEWLLFALAANGPFILLVASDRLNFTFREAASTKLPLRELEHLATMLAWLDREVQIQVTGDVPDITLRTRVSGEGRAARDTGVADTIAMLRNQASRTTVADFRLSLDDVLASYQVLSDYLDVLSNAQTSIGIRLDESSFDSAIVKYLLGIIDVEIGDFTFAMLFDAATESGTR